MGLPVVSPERCDLAFMLPLGMHMATRGRDAQRAGDDDAAVVDQLVRKLQANNPARGPAPLTSAALHAGARPSGLDANPGARARLAAPNPKPRDLGPAGVWVRVGLGVVVAVALPQWPYARACGMELLVYLLAVATVLVGGLWGAMASWRGRLASAHIIALGSILWGLALGAHEVLPRAGYIPSSASWRCLPSHGAIPPSRGAETAEVLESPGPTRAGSPARTC